MGGALAHSLNEACGSDGKQKKRKGALKNQLEHLETDKVFGWKQQNDGIGI
jgi:hypothetical protein